MNWQSLAIRFLLGLLAPSRTRLAFCRTHKIRRVFDRFKRLGLLAPSRTRLAFRRTHKTRRVFGRFKQLGLLAPSRTRLDRKSTRLNSSHSQISYAVFCL